MADDLRLETMDAASFITADAGTRGVLLAGRRARRSVLDRHGRGRVQTETRGVGRIARGVAGRVHILSRPGAPLLLALAGGTRSEMMT
jgi:hypothetical protein